MISVLVSREFQVSAEDMWALLGNFGDISWAPGMDRVEVEGSGPGMVRKIFMEPDGESIDEVLESMDESHMSFVYTIPRNLPMPITEYRAGPTVIDLGDGRCRVDWRGSGEPNGVSEAEAEATMQGFYDLLLGWVDDHFQNQNKQAV